MFDVEVQQDGTRTPTLVFGDEPSREAAASDTRHGKPGSNSEQRESSRARPERAKRVERGRHLRRLENV